MKNFYHLNPWLIVLFSILLIAGGELFWFLCDDAYISFRYASNWINGYGLTWNLPPFQPVEGYSNFLWIVLWTVSLWRTGIEPPTSAGWVSLLFGLLSYMVIIAFCSRIIHARFSSLQRNLLLSLCLVYIVFNRTFLTWLSSGLETSLFNFLIIAWLYKAIDQDKQNPSQQAYIALCLLASLLALTRPDGLLFYLATVFLVTLNTLSQVRVSPPHLFRPKFFYAIALLTIIPVHLLWRYFYYNAWLPNTYYAKVIGMWPEMGLKYLTSFIIEYGLYIWIAVGCLWFIKHFSLKHFISSKLNTSIAIATLSGHIAYYTIIVGGDHFEYRVFSHLIPLAAISMLAMLAHLFNSPTKQIGIFIVFITVSLPIPITHWWHTKDINSRAETFKLSYPIAQHFPKPIQTSIDFWDSLQSDLIFHMVGTRHQTHKVLHSYQIATNIARENGLKIDWNDREILVAGGVGIPGWVQPNTAIIDVYGLNDRNVARSSDMISKKRMMAHSRNASKEYIQCFKPSEMQNIFMPKEIVRAELSQNKVTPNMYKSVYSIARETKPSDTDIQNCEQKKW